MVATPDCERRPASAAAFALTAIALAATAVRSTVADGTVATAALVYATPVIVIAGMLALAAYLWVRNGRRARAASACAVLALASVAWWSLTAYRRGPAEPPPYTAGAAVRVMLWNVARGVAGRERVAAAIRAVDPDVLALVEPCARTARCHDEWRALLPGLTGSSSRSAMMVLARGAVHGGDDVIRLGPGSRARRFRVRTGATEVELLLVDVVANPLGSRAAPLARIVELAGAAGEVPRIVLGDFNTPIDSIHVEPLRRYMREAFEEAGSGHHATWPVPLPVLALDQAWLSPAIAVERALLPSTWLSDHRPLVFEIRVARRPGRAGPG